MPDAAKGSVLFLAQLPPPYHGQSVIASRVKDALETGAGMAVDQRWRGGARSNDDIGSKSFAKLFAFFGFVLELLALFVSRRRYELAYLGMAPWAHTALRDALLAALAKGLSRRVLLHVHGDGLDPILEGNNLRDRFIRACLAGTELIAITEGSGHSAAKKGVFSRVIHLPNMAPDPGALTSDGTGPLKIACLGNLDPRKGVLDFVDTVSDLVASGHKVEATIIGGPTAHLDVDSVRRRAQEKGAADAIRVTGWVSEEEKSGHLADADVFLYLSRHDLAPVALIEALAHGCAPVVLDIGGLREMVGPQLGDCVLDASGTAEACVAGARKRIETWLADADRLAADKAAARARYLDMFSPAQFRQRVAAMAGGTNRSQDGPSGSNADRLVGETS